MVAGRPRCACVILSGGTYASVPLWKKMGKFVATRVGVSCQREEDCVEPRNKFRSIYEQISLVNMTGNQQSVNICYYLLITLPDKFMAVDCWHIRMKIYFPQLTGCSLVLWSTPFVNVKLESRRQLN